MIASAIPSLAAFAVSVLKLAIWLALLSAIFVPLERFFAVRPARVWRAQAGVDLAWYFINSLLPSLLIALPLAMLTRAVEGFDPGGYYSHMAALPIGIRLLAAMFVNDLGAYFYHRWSHRNHRLWRFHAVHHSAEHLDWLVSTRGHPFDMVLTRLSGMTLVYLFGLSPSSSGGPGNVVALVTIVGVIWTFFIHANVRWRLGPLEWFVTSPAFHHWHHSNDAHRDHNFAAIFPVIDRVFGTLYLPKTWPPVYGIDAPMDGSLSGQFLDPLLPQAAPAN